MPCIHQINDEYIYNALNNKTGPIYKWDENSKVYKYTNTLFPNKNYKKIFDPKSFMSRGDIVHFGDDNYRNNNKMIFDGEKLEHLYTEVDDYGSVPPTYVVGDGPGEFNIGDFENIINHNTINWLSKEKLKEIEIYQKDDIDIIYGQVIIKGKKWIIIFHILEDREFNTGYRYWNSRQYNCYLEDDNIIINIVKSDKLYNVKYLLKIVEVENYNKFKLLVKENSKINITGFTFKDKDYSESQYLNGPLWYAYIINKEYKLDINNMNLKFPLIWKKITEKYTSETLLLDEESYKFYIKLDNKILDNIYINEITGYQINIKLIKNNSNELIDNINSFITSLIDNYDNIDKRYPFNRDGYNSLEIYI
jgi:hypothetical protein